jgi:hypothetical protein
MSQNQVEDIWNQWSEQTIGILDFLVRQLQLLNPIAIVVGSLKDRQLQIQ